MLRAITIEVDFHTEDKGAFLVVITGKGFNKKGYKWFYGIDKTWPASTPTDFGTELYHYICTLIRKVATTKKKIVTGYTFGEVKTKQEKKSFYPDAIAHQIACENAGACYRDKR